MVTRSPNPIDIHVGRRVRMRRMMLGMTQTGLAEAIGLTFQQVQKYEKGSNRMGASRLQQIAQALQVPVPFFFEGASGFSDVPNGAAAPLPADVSEFLASSDGVAMVKAFMRIRSAKLRRCVADLVEQIAQSCQD